MKDPQKGLSFDNTGRYLGKRMNINFVSNINTSDPASIAFDGAKSGMNKMHDHVIIDTAGRLHTSKKFNVRIRKNI